MRKNGFTLIELLAVIVILAIIAVIAVPIVLNIINDTKESSVLRSADFYLDGVEKSIATSKLKNIQIENGTYSIMKDGNICIGTLNNNICTGDILKVEMDGEVPKEGTITITNGQVTNLEFNYNNKVITKDDSGKLVYKTDSKTLSELAVVSAELGVNNIENCTKKGQICQIDEDGVAFAIKVNATETYKFYVLSDDGDTVNLIMKGNLGQFVWYDGQYCATLEMDYDEDGIIDETLEDCSAADGSKGPLTILETLKTRTTTWENIEEYSYDLEEKYGYSGEYVQNVRARLPMLSEITAEEIGCTEWEDTCPDWMDNGEPYWLEDFYSIDSYDGSYRAWLTDGNQVLDGRVDQPYALCPIITVKK